MNNTEKGWEELFFGEDPPDLHEKRMQKRLDNAFRKETTVNIWYKVAAVLVIAFGLFWFFSNGLDFERENHFAEDLNDGIPIKEASAYYEQSFQNSHKLLVAQNNTLQSRTLIKNSMEMIADLDTQYSLLEDELSKTGDRRVAAAMIKNYKQRIEILEALIQKINYVNNLKKLSDEDPTA